MKYNDLDYYLNYYLTMNTLIPSLHQDSFWGLPINAYDLVLQL